MVAFQRFDILDRMGF